MQKKWLFISGSGLLLIALIAIGVVVWSLPTVQSSTPMPLTQAQPQAPLAQSGPQLLTGNYRGAVTLQRTQPGLYSDPLPTPTPGGPPAPDLGAVDLSLWLNRTNNTISGYVALAETLIFTVEHTITATPVGPTPQPGTPTSAPVALAIGPQVQGTFDGAQLTLTSEKITDLINGRTIERQFRLSGTVTQPSDRVVYISGEYRETIWGYTMQPMTVIGAFTLEQVLFPTFTPVPTIPTATPSATHTPMQTPTATTTSTNLPPTATPTATPTTTPTVTPTTMPNAVAVSLPTNAAGAPNSQVTIPVLIPNAVNAHNIIAYSFQLTFNPAVLTFVEANTTGTMSNGWTVTPNSSTPGAVHVVAFNATPLSGSGTLINLVFNVVGNAGSTTALTWTDFVFNEGSPAAQTSNGFFTASAWRIGGSVSYRTTTRSMAGVTVTLSGTSQSQQTTTSSGGYTFTLQASGVHTVTPSLSGQVNGISAFDAAYVAQCVAGVRALSDCPLLAADASGNNALSAFDAAQVAQYVAGLAAPTSRVGRWVFSPTSRTYGALTSDLLTEGYAAYLVGEVSGNWQAPTASAAAASDTGPAPLLAASRDDLAVTLGSVAPVGDLLAFQLTLHYDPTAGRLHAALPAAALAAAGWELVVNEAVPGVVELVAYGGASVQDGGELVTLHFLDAAGQPVALTSTIRRVQINEEPLWLDLNAAPDTLRQRQFLPLAMNY